MKTVFLGGTCNGSKWRDDLIPQLKIGFFNPVVENWTPECQEREIKARQESDWVLYVITPLMKGFYSIAEIVEDSNKRPNKTLFCFLEKDVDQVFDNHQIKSLKATAKLIEQNGGRNFGSLNEAVEFLNNN